MRTSDASALLDASDPFAAVFHRLMEKNTSAGHVLPYRIAQANCIRFEPDAAFTQPGGLLQHLQDASTGASIESKRFAAHLVLYLQKMGQVTGNQVGASIVQQILEEYAGALIKKRQISMLAPYCAHMSEDAGARVYAHLLKNVITDEERKLVVRLAEKYFSSERMVQMSIEQAVTSIVSGEAGSRGEEDGVLLSAAQKVKDEYFAGTTFQDVGKSVSPMLFHKIWALRWFCIRESDYCLAINRGVALAVDLLLLEEDWSLSIFQGGSPSVLATEVLLRGSRARESSIQHPVSLTRPLMNIDVDRLRVLRRTLLDGGHDAEVNDIWHLRCLQVFCDSQRLYCDWRDFIESLPDRSPPSQALQRGARSGTSYSADEHVREEVHGDWSLLKDALQRAEAPMKWILERFQRRADSSHDDGEGMWLGPFGPEASEKGEEQPHFVELRRRVFLLLARQLQQMYYDSGKWLQQCNAVLSDNEVEASTRWCFEECLRVSETLANAENNIMPFLDKGGVRELLGSAAKAAEELLVNSPVTNDITIAPREA